MSNLPQIIITADSEAVLEKKKIWSEVGLVVHNANITLAAKAKAALDLLNGAVPKNINEILGAEVVLKQVKLTLTETETERKDVTSKFDAVTKALMVHEKAIKDAIPAYEAAIISIKKADEQAREQARLAEQKIKQDQEFAITNINQQSTAIESLIAEQCQKAYEHALNTNITIEKLGEFLEGFKSKMPANKLTLNKPVTITQENWDYAFKYLDAPNYEDYRALFVGEVTRKFEFYETALNNKEAAIALSKESEARKEAERAEELANKNVAAHLETIAQPIPVFSSSTKDLKKKYEVDLPETDANAVLIITAFLTNYQLVKDGIRVSQAFNLSVKQMASALAWYKNKDENFSATGIKFKTTEKL